MLGFTTRAVHANAKRKDEHNALRPAVYETVAFEFESSRDIELAFMGKKNAHSYSRISNPTVDDFEKRVAEISNSLGVIALSSGMAAISNVFMALAVQGGNAVVSKTLFGNTVSLLNETLAQLGYESRFVDVTDIDDVESSIDDKTDFVFLEVVSNPQMQVADIASVVEVANKKSVPVVLDGTLSTPYLFDAGKAGVAVEVISSTKYISGGATSTGGLIIDYGNFDWSFKSNLRKWTNKYGPYAFVAKLRREVFRNLGACMSPHSAWLHTLGLETLTLRIERSCSNALFLAKWLDSHKKVLRVDYPGIESNKYFPIAKKEFKNGFGGLLSFDLASKETAFIFMDSLKLIRRASNLNDNKSLIIHPASTIFSEYSTDELTAMGVRNSQIRLSVGIENKQDLIDDIKQALENI